MPRRRNNDANGDAAQNASSVTARQQFWESERNTLNLLRTVCEMGGGKGARWDEVAEIVGKGKVNSFSCKSKYFQQELIARDLRLSHHAASRAATEAPQEPRIKQEAANSDNDDEDSDIEFLGSTVIPDQSESEHSDHMSTTQPLQTKAKLAQRKKRKHPGNASVVPTVESETHTTSIDRGSSVLPAAPKRAKRHRHSRVQTIEDDVSSPSDDEDHPALPIPARKASRQHRKSSISVTAGREKEQTSNNDEASIIQPQKKKSRKKTGTSVNEQAHGTLRSGGAAVSQPENVQSAPSAPSTMMEQIIQRRLNDIRKAAKLPICMPESFARSLVPVQPLVNHQQNVGIGEYQHLNQAPRSWENNYQNWNINFVTPHQPQNRTRNWQPPRTAQIEYTRRKADVLPGLNNKTVVPVRKVTRKDKK